MKPLYKNLFVFLSILLIILSNISYINAEDKTKNNGTIGIFFLEVNNNTELSTAQTGVIKSGSWKGKNEFKPGDTVYITISSDDKLFDSCNDPRIVAEIIDPENIKQTERAFLGHSVKKGEYFNGYSPSTNKQAFVVYKRSNLLGKYTVKTWLECPDKSPIKKLTSVDEVKFYYIEDCEEGYQSEEYCWNDDVVRDWRACPNGAIINKVIHDCHGEGYNDCDNAKCVSTCTSLEWGQWSDNQNNCGVRYKYDSCGNLIDKEESSCSVNEICGNNKREGNEECDGSDLDGKSCNSFGYNSGTLKCNNCGFDKTNCSTIQEPKTNTPNCKIKGDTNNNGLIEIGDILNIFYASQGKKKLGDLSCYDMNSDGNVNQEDVNLITKLWKGEIKQEPLSKIDIISYSDMIEEGFIGHVIWENTEEAEKSEIIYGNDKNNLANKKEGSKNDYNQYVAIITPNPDSFIPQPEEKNIYFKIHSEINGKDYYSDIYSIELLTHEEAYSKNYGTQLASVQDARIFITGISADVLSKYIGTQINNIYFQIGSCLENGWWTGWCAFDIITLWPEFWWGKGAKIVKLGKEVKILNGFSSSQKLINLLGTEDEIFDSIKSVEFTRNGVLYNLDQGTIKKLRGLGLVYIDNIDESKKLLLKNADLVEYVVNNGDKGVTALKNSGFSLNEIDGFVKKGILKELDTGISRLSQMSGKSEDETLSYFKNQFENTLKGKEYLLSTLKRSGSSVEEFNKEKWISFNTMNGKNIYRGIALEGVPDASKLKDLPEVKKIFAEGEFSDGYQAANKDVEKFVSGDYYDYKNRIEKGAFVASSESKNIATNKFATTVKITNEVGEVVGEEKRYGIVLHINARGTDYIDAYHTLKNSPNVSPTVRDIAMSDMEILKSERILPEDIIGISLVDPTGKQLAYIDNTISYIGGAV